MKHVPVAVALSLSACVIPEATDELSVSEQSIIKDNCDETGCGMNSPHVDNYGFHFLLRNGQENPQGFAIKSVKKNGIEYKLDVTNGRITASAPDMPTLAEATLVGTWLHISLEDDPRYVIQISGVQRTFSWATKSTGERFPVYTYLLEWTDIVDDGKFTNVCSHPGVDDTLGMNAYHTVVFEGDVIDAATKTVADSVDNDILNIGCAGGTLAKQHLTGHTEVAARLGFATDTKQRQANLKMLTADYCGTGKAFTIGGQPLQWADHRGWVDVVGNVSREALWTSEGAACLNKPRLVANASTFGTEMFGTVRQIEDAIKTECGGTRPVWCGSGSAYYPPLGYHLVSSNPY